jgi:hypothetical protein
MPDDLYHSGNLGWSKAQAERLRANGLPARHAEHVDPAAPYARALTSLGKPRPPGGMPPRVLPETVALTATELRDEEFGAIDLLERIRSAMSPA